MLPAWSVLFLSAVLLPWVQYTAGHPVEECKSLDKHYPTEVEASTNYFHPGAKHCFPVE